MDAPFLKFWKDFLAQAAGGTHRWADLTRWMAGGFSGAPDLTALFRSAYGLTPPGSDDPWRTEAWNEAAARFQTSWGEFLEAFQFVSLDRYEKLRREKADLGKKVAAHEKTIAALRLELAQFQMSDGRVLDGFRQLMDVQQEQFRQVSDSLDRFFRPAPRKTARRPGLKK